MILDVPSPADFESNGLAFLNLAWKSVLGLSQGFSESSNNLTENEVVTQEELEDLKGAYWKEAQPALAVAVALAHQAAEFLLKARIASVSPYLLLSSEKWPSGADKSDKSYADFKTVDSQDLVRIHDTVGSSRLPDDFKQKLDELRKLRNTIMHSVDARRPYAVRDCVLMILEIAEVLIGPKSWQKVRSEYEEKRVNYRDYSEFNPNHPFAMETLHVIDCILKPAEVKRFYEFDKKQRRYICFNCHEDYADGFVRSCQLKPNDSNSTKVFCICCLETFRVIRLNCPHLKCKGNVMGPDRWLDNFCCLTCGEPIEHDIGYEEYLGLIKE